MPVYLHLKVSHRCLWHMKANACHLLVCLLFKRTAARKVPQVAKDDPELLILHPPPSKCWITTWTAIPGLVFLSEWIKYYLATILWVL